LELDGLRLKKDQFTNYTHVDPLLKRFFEEKVSNSS
jgi:hypothetical protein